MTSLVRDVLHRHACEVTAAQLATLVGGGATTYDARQVLNALHTQGEVRLVRPGVYEPTANLQIPESSMAKDMTMKRTYAVEAIGQRGNVLHTTYVDAWPGRETSPAVRSWMRIFVDGNSFRLRARVADPVADLGCVPADQPPVMTQPSKE